MKSSKIHAARLHGSTIPNKRGYVSIEFNPLLPSKYTAAERSQLRRFEKK